MLSLNPQRSEKGVCREMATESSRKIDRNTPLTLLIFLAGPPTSMYEKSPAQSAELQFFAEREGFEPRTLSPEPRTLNSEPGTQ